jgi:hypothetical protein
MQVGFGFSVGDFISILYLIRDLIKALEDGAGSGKEYRELIRELHTLERTLLDIKGLKVDDSLQHQKQAIEQAACQCQNTVSTFLSKVEKYGSALSSKGAGNSVKEVLRKVQWTLWQKEDIKKFRAQIAGHSSSLLTLLATLQLLV